MVQSDVLIRNTLTHTADDNVDQILLPDGVFAEQRIQSFHIATELLEIYKEQPRHSSVEGDLEQAIKRHMHTDAYARTIQQCLDNPLLPLPARTTTDDWKQDDHMLFFRGQCYIPSDLQLRCKIVALYHDTPVAGHSGRF